MTPVQTPVRLPTPTPVIDPLDIPRRLDEFRLLRDGWLAGEGIAPRPADLDWLATAFADRFPADLPRPRLYPTAEGGVQAEWMLGRRDISLTVDLPARSAYWHVLNLASDQDDDRHLDLSGAQAWAWVVDQLAHFGRATA